MRFIKMQGAGNDYVYVDCIRQSPPRDPAKLSQRISDRHFGVGADGLILVCPSERADARMRMFNADGSEAEMCGNGVRCVAKLIHDHGIAPRPVVTVETGRGVLTLELTVQKGKVTQARVDMGEPILEAPRIPTTLPGTPPLLTPLEVDGVSYPVTCVSMGNPHCVLLVDEITDWHVHQLGPKIEKHPAFPRRTNVEYLQVLGEGEARMRVWERGSGETLACGTGACASAVAGILAGKLGRRLTMHLLGGDLLLEWPEGDGHVYMTGPAVEVFTGEWPDEAS